MKRSEVRARIEEIGIVPLVRVSTTTDGRFAAQAVQRGGIPIVEVTMTTPGALEVLGALANHTPDLIVGAGSVIDADSARRCIEAGARFLTSPGFDCEVVDLAIHHDIAVFPGVFTPTDVMAAWKPRPDFLKVYPCAPAGGAAYIRLLKAPFSDIPLVAAGGITQKTAGDFIAAGADALSLGSELVPPEAVALRDEGRILELCRRFLSIVRQARRARHPAPQPGASQHSKGGLDRIATSHCAGSGASVSPVNAPHPSSIWHYRQSDIAGFRNHNWR